MICLLRLGNGMLDECLFVTFRMHSRKSDEMSTIHGRTLSNHDIRQFRQGHMSSPYELT